MSVTEPALRIAAMEAVIDHGYSLRLVAEKYKVSKAALENWNKLHRSGKETLGVLLVGLPQKDNERLNDLRAKREQWGRRDRRGSSKEPSPLVVEIELEGTIDFLGATTLMSRLIHNSAEYGNLTEGDVSLPLPNEVIRKLHIDDKVTVKIVVERFPIKEQP